MNYKISRIFMILVLALSFSGYPGYCADEANVQDTDWVSIPSGASSSATPSVAMQKTGASVAETSVSTTSEDADSTPATSPGNVTVNFKGADIKTVLAYISEVA
ncbi:MAG: hypothetical protein KBB52_07780, partial [Candidatus Omnitrophica bacterium]|nr:hypothetical protein [Candidatus Omnitrophota bacterium]